MKVPVFCMNGSDFAHEMQKNRFHLLGEKDKTYLMRVRSNRETFVFEMPNLNKVRCCCWRGLY